MPSLIPRERRFYDLFDKQIAVVNRAAQVLAGCLRDAAALRDQLPRIKDLEHEGDELMHEVVRTLHRTFVTPFDREDIYALASGLDDVLDYVEEIADTIFIYGITDVPATAEEMYGLVVAAVAELQKAVGDMEGRGTLVAHGIEVHRLENVGDVTSRRAIGELFSGRYDPLTVIKLKDLYQLLEDALDRCEDVANVLESISIKNG